MRLLTALFALLPLAAWAEPFERPIPQSQTESAELWYLAASIALVVALGAVQVLVNRR
ncbi:hypothetical protein [Oceaniglobus trochenteri]|uniref:hypothetical protein n=1 Tax=Oceaniglobus trochenteri TaxID=2763260 RepID=UPI001CFFEA6D|nr:hypothetical protein [Oceaniglobus trochenteri]